MARTVIDEFHLYAESGALILASAMMLRHIGETNAASRLETAMRRLVKEGTHVTQDLSPSKSVTTVEMANALIKLLTS